MLPARSEASVHTRAIRVNGRIHSMGLSAWQRETREDNGQIRKYLYKHKRTHLRLESRNLALKQRKLRIQVSHPATTASAHEISIHPSVPLPAGRGRSGYLNKLASFCTSLALRSFSTSKALKKGSWRAEANQGSNLFLVQYRYYLTSYVTVVDFWSKRGT